MTGAEWDRGLARDPAAPGRWHLELGADWCVRSYFGGMAMARLLRAIEAESGRGLAPLTAAATFARPLAAGPAVAEVRIVREGKSMLFATATLVQGGSSAVTLTALLGASEARPPQSAATRRPASVAEHVEWRCDSDWGTGELTARIRAVDSELRGRYWHAVAADLIGPAVAAEPFWVNTISLEVQFLRDTASEWLEQRVRAGLIDGLAWGLLELSDPDGLVATASHRALLRPATRDDLPFCLTAFGDG